MANKPMKPLTHREVARLHRALLRFRATVRFVPGYEDVMDMDCASYTRECMNATLGLVADVAGDLTPAPGRIARAFAPVVRQWRRERMAWRYRDEWPWTDGPSLVRWIIGFKLYGWAVDARYRLVCRVKGHDWDSFADAENGYEEVWCKRCGDGHSCYMT